MEPDLAVFWDHLRKLTKESAAEERQKTDQAFADLVYQLTEINKLIIELGEESPQSFRGLLKIDMRKEMDKIAEAERNNAKMALQAFKPQSRSSADGIRSAGA